MAYRRILKYPEDEEILRVPSPPVTDFGDSLQATVRDLFETSKFASGLGLAAPQIGVHARVFIITMSDCGKKEFVNPVLVDQQGEIEVDEGCLSFPGKYISVKRARTLKVHALTRFNEPFEMEARDLFAVALQHECDHLDGVLYIDRA